jgi:hypothetical protein
VPFITSISATMPSCISVKSILGILCRAPVVSPDLDREWALERDAVLQDARPLPIPERTQLHAMPTEVLQKIARYLPAHSEAALTLTCRSVLWKLGGRSWLEIDKWQPSDHELLWEWGRYSYKPERVLLLMLLDRDIKHLINCFFCRKLHDPAKTTPRTRRANTRERRCTKFERRRRDTGFRRYGVYFHLHDDITFSEIQSFMKLHLRFGIDCTSQLQRLSRTATFKFRASNATYQLSTLARMISGRLIIRSEYYIVIGWSTVAGRWVDLAVNEAFSSLNICPHAHDQNYFYDIRLRGSGHSEDVCFPCLMKHDNDHCRVPYTYEPGLRYCEFCATEFQLDLNKLEKGLALAFTVWQDFGDCSSPHETIWDWTWYVDDTHWRSVRWEVGSIKAGFEAVSSNVPAPLRALPDLPKKRKGLRLYK